MDPQAFICLGSRKGQSSDLEADENKAGRRLCHHCSCSLSMRLHSQSAKDEMENLGLVFGLEQAWSHIAVNRVQLVLSCLV